MPGFIPSRESDTLVVQLGYAFAAVFTAGSPNLQSIGFTFLATDVSAVVMVLSGGPDHLTDVTWTTVLSFTDASHVVLNVSLPDNSTSGVIQVVLYRAVNSAMNYPLMGSVQCDLSLTQHSTARFTIVSLDGSLIITAAKVGIPVLITDTEASPAVDYFGGQIDQSQVTNEPGTKTVYSAVDCKGWEVICDRRGTGVSDAVADNDTTLGAANPSQGQFVNVRADQIITYWVAHALFDDGVTANLDTSGPQLPTFSSIGAKVSDGLDQLVSASTPKAATPQFQWFMSPRRVLNYIKQGSIAAPFNISDTDGSDNQFLMQLQNTITLQNYFNRGIAEITQVAQTFIGDGVTTSFTLAQAVPTSALGQVRITLNGNSQTIGVAGTDIGKQWYYTLGSKTITSVGSATAWASNVSYNQNDVVTRAGNLYTALVGSNKGHDPVTSPTFWKPWGAAGPLQNTDVLIVSFPVFVIYAFDDVAAQQAQSTLQSGSGISEAKINLNALNSVVDAETFVQSMVEVAKDIAQQVQVMTYRPGLNIGQTIQVNLKDIGLDSQGSPALGAFFLIDSVKIATDNRRKLFTVTASIDAPIVGGWAAQLKRGLGTGGGVNAHPLAVPLSAAGFAGGIGSGAPGGGTGTGTVNKQIPSANLVPVRSWIDETGRQPILNAMNNTESVPARYNGYLFYGAACNDGTFQIFKSTDHGRTWAALDTIHAPADVGSPIAGGLSGSCVFDGGFLLYCATVKPHAGANLSVQVFNLATEKWATAQPSTTPAELICTMHWRPNNRTILITYDRGAVDPSPTRSRFWGVSFQVDALTFGTAFDIGAQLLNESSNVTGDVNSTFVTGVTDPLGRTHFFLSNNAATYFWYQAVELGDSRSSSYVFANAAGTRKLPSWVTNSNAVILTEPNGVQHVGLVVVTHEQLGGEPTSSYHLRVLTSGNLSPGVQDDLDWFLGGAQL